MSKPDSPLVKMGECKRSFNDHSKFESVFTNYPPKSSFLCQFLHANIDTKIWMKKYTWLIDWNEVNHNKEARMLCYY